MTYRFDKDGLGKGEVFFNVKNLFNKFPTVYYSGQITQPSSQPFTPEGDDTVGRYFTAGIRLKF
jgi:iron complex outermembrane recepter protein